MLYTAKDMLYGHSDTSFGKKERLEEDACEGKDLRLVCSKGEERGP